MTLTGEISIGSLNQRPRWGSGPRYLVCDSRVRYVYTQYASLFLLTFYLDRFSGGGRSIRHEGNGEWEMITGEAAYQVATWSSAKPKAFLTSCLLPPESTSVPEYRPYG